MTIYLPPSPAPPTRSTFFVPAMAALMLETTPPRKHILPHALYLGRFCLGLHPRHANPRNRQRPLFELPCRSARLCLWWSCPQHVSRRDGQSVLPRSKSTWNFCLAAQSLGESRASEANPSSGAKRGAPFGEADRRHSLGTSGLTGNRTAAARQLPRRRIILGAKPRLNKNAQVID